MAGFQALRDGRFSAPADRHSRYVLSWDLSITLDADFCVATLDRALEGGRPLIFNTDQGSQFTGASFTGRLKEAWTERDERSTTS